MLEFLLQITSSWWDGVHSCEKPKLNESWQKCQKISMRAPTHTKLFLYISKWILNEFHIDVLEHAQITWLFLIVVARILCAVASFLNYIWSPLLAYRLLFTQHLGLNIKINIFSHLPNLIKQEKVYRKWKSWKTHGVWWYAGGKNKESTRVLKDIWS